MTKCPLCAEPYVYTVYKCKQCDAEMCGRCVRFDSYKTLGGRVICKRCAALRGGNPVA